MLHGRSSARGKRASAEVTFDQVRVSAAIDRDVSSPDHTQERNMQ